MYTKIKNIALKLIPKNVLFNYEYSLRYLYYLTRKGNKFHCLVCDSKLSDFITTNNHLVCPRCGSIQRNRRLWQVLNGGLLKEHMSILHFSPSRSLYRQLKKGNHYYVSTDISGDFLADKSYDITNIDAANERYDLIICYHILEHINDDLKAMNELLRVLAKCGHCIIQTPFKDGSIYEDESIVTPQEREKYFGQDDHVRIYSVQGLQKRLEDAGFEVKVTCYQEKKDNIYGLDELETIFICNRPI